MKLHNFNYECGNCGRKFKSPELLGNPYGEFLMRSEKGDIAYLYALDNVVFKEFSDMLAQHSMISGMQDVEQAKILHQIFGFACAPVNLGLLEHVQYYVWILKKYVSNETIKNEHINFNSNEIDYLETTIKCVELFQWLARHFNNKNFERNAIKEGVCERCGCVINYVKKNGRYRLLCIYPPEGPLVCRNRRPAYPITHQC